jgi:hypothetical protein
MGSVGNRLPFGADEPYLLNVKLPQWFCAWPSHIDQGYSIHYTYTLGAAKNTAASKTAYRDRPVYVGRKVDGRPVVMYTLRRGAGVAPWKDPDSDWSSSPATKAQLEAWDLASWTVVADADEKEMRSWT